jgi:hypothetical protein
MYSRNKSHLRQSTLARQSHSRPVGELTLADCAARARPFAEPASASQNISTIIFNLDRRLSIPQTGGGLTVLKPPSRQ